MKIPDLHGRLGLQEGFIDHRIPGYLAMAIMDFGHDATSETGLHQSLLEAHVYFDGCLSKSSREIEAVQPFILTSRGLRGSGARLC
jgi:hypothetical protein